MIFSFFLLHKKFFEFLTEKTMSEGHCAPGFL